MSSPHLYTSHYIYNNDDIYISLIADAPYSIGSQIINSNVPTGTLNIFTKLNLTNDFNFRLSNVGINENLFTVSIIPNPSVHNIKLEIISNTKDNISTPFTIIFKNLISNKTTVKQNYISKTVFDISTLERGQYFVEVINSKGEKAGSKFIKL